VCQLLDCRQKCGHDETSSFSPVELQRAQGKYLRALLKLEEAAAFATNETRAVDDGSYAMTSHSAARIPKPQQSATRVQRIIGTKVDGRF
jgi:hypothetical protein